MQKLGRPFGFTAICVGDGLHRSSAWMEGCPGRRVIHLSVIGATADTPGPFGYFLVILMLSACVAVCVVR